MDIHADSPGYGNDSTIFGGYIFHSKYGDVHAYCLDATREFIRSHMGKITNGIFVEIGVYGGSTLLDIYDVCNANNNKIYGIDPWDKLTIFNGMTEADTDIMIRNQEIARYKTIKHNLYDIINRNNLSINLINENSWDSYQLFEDNSIDCIHIDGDHSYNGVKRDLELFYPKIKHGGMIINDDYHWSGCKKAIHEFIANHKNDIIETYTLQNNEKYVMIKQ